MSDSSPEQGVQRFVLKVPTPLRAFAVAAGCEVVGAVLIVLWSALELSLVAVVLGGILLAFGGGLFLAAVLLPARWTQTVELTRREVTVGRGQQNRTLTWSQVKQVTSDGTRLTLQAAPEDGGPVRVVNPGGAAESVFLALSEAIRESLDADRGYQPLQ